MKEQLSAMMDGELADEMQAHLGRLRADPELRAAWDIYHLIGDSLRGQVSPAIAPRVISRLREEPTVLAPRPARRTAARIGWYGTYAAASLAAVAVVAWTAFPGWHSDPQLASASIPPENVVVVQPPADVENYLLAHQPYRAMQGIERTAAAQ
jgi:sigma-E factor negative regulatory protein RseA